MFSTKIPYLFLESLGTGEVLLVVFVIIIFFGGKKIPEMARVIGKGMREFKAAANNIQDEIQKSVTEIERNVNVEGALNEEQPRPKYTRENDPVLTPRVSTTPSPQLIRSDEPEIKDVKKDTPPTTPAN
jgi:sec-independent protein translocase protein TatA